MATITTPRLSNATEQYSREQLDQIIKTLEQMILTLNTNYQPRATENKGEAESWYFSFTRRA